MEITAKQYEIAVNNAAEISQALLDMEGGKYILALLNELVQAVLDERNISGAALVVRKVHEGTEVPVKQSVLDGDNKAAWIYLFSDALKDTLEETVP